MEIERQEIVSSLENVSNLKFLKLENVDFNALIKNEKGLYACDASVIYLFV